MLPASCLQVTGEWATGWGCAEQLCSKVVVVSKDLSDDVQRRVFFVLVGEVLESSPGSTGHGGGAGSRSQHVWSQPHLPPGVCCIPNVCLVGVDLTGALHGLA